MSVVTGAAVNLQCETTGSPAARIEWINGNDQVIQVSNQCETTGSPVTTRFSRK